MNQFILDKLVIDMLLKNTNNHKNSDDEFNKFFRFSDGKGINNASGFRPKSRANKSTNIENCAFCILITNFGEPEWPDSIDLENGIFTYFGDKREPGDLHNTSVGGNRFLRHIFELLHKGLRSQIPPVFVFQNLKYNNKSHMKFLGLAVPGGHGLSAFDDLVAVWRVKEDTRFQNYRAKFTILKTGSIPKEWLESLVSDEFGIAFDCAPETWKKWVQDGIYRPLTCERKLIPRETLLQKPSTSHEINILATLIDSLNDREFEYAAIEIIYMMDNRFFDFFITQRSRDGGRDAIGKYKIGHIGHEIFLDVFLEAKLWRDRTEIGVKPMSRLISRIKHRDLGIFITTTQFSRQVQEELIEDNHPILLISGGDISKILIDNEFDNNNKLESWIKNIKSKAAGFI